MRYVGDAWWSAKTGRWCDEHRPAVGRDRRLRLFRCWPRTTLMDSAADGYRAVGSALQQDFQIAVTCGWTPANACGQARSRCLSGEF